MWNKLTMQEKAKYIKVAVKRGMTDLSDIQNTYNSFIAEYENKEGGGKIKDKNIYEGGGGIGNFLGESLTGMIPIYGAYRDIKTAVKDPSWSNIAIAGLSTVLDGVALLSGGTASGLTAAGKGLFRASLRTGIKPIIKEVVNTMAAPIVKKESEKLAIKMAEEQGLSRVTNSIRRQAVREITPKANQLLIKDLSTDAALQFGFEVLKNSVQTENGKYIWEP